MRAAMDGSIAEACTSFAWTRTVFGPIHAGLGTE